MADYQELIKRLKYYQEATFDAFQEAKKTSQDIDEMEQQLVQVKNLMKHADYEAMNLLKGQERELEKNINGANGYFKVCQEQHKFIRLSAVEFLTKNPEFVDEWEDGLKDSIMHMIIEKFMKEEWK